ncbi:Qat anti-phage system QueC-like protein QatC [Candidatus Hydrogenedentota bacterium]
MKKVMCCPISLLPDALDPDAIYLNQYSSTERNGVGHMGIGLPRIVCKDGFAPSLRAWDFAAIAFAVSAADKTVPRKESADGWTRMIDLSICLSEPAPWEAKRTEFESVLGFLTGDVWTLHFLDGGVKPLKTKRRRQTNAECVCLLSGGIDSLIGAIDLTSAGRKPIFVSHVARGSKDSQEKYARTLCNTERHCQWPFSVKHHGDRELSTRGRSIVFFAFAALAASAIQSSQERPVEIVVPENGFISLNVPLGPGRIGSLSTKTTHPIYMDGIQSIWDAMGIHARLSFPYRNKTKGDLLIECADQAKLNNLIGDSVSCGKYGRHNLTHCGACVPCMVRRAAFLKAGLVDRTKKGYLCKSLGRSEAKDVAATASAFLRYQDKGIRRFVGGALSFASSDERDRYEDVVARGMDELGQLLRAHGVL